jgi:hypothetical protein
MVSRAHGLADKHSRAHAQTEYYVSQDERYLPPDIDSRHTFRPAEVAHDEHISHVVERLYDV